ncbi:hypothetical protein N7522_009089 [Penicillium canescens]|uniref:Uncharacterized protein n=1 Tax=Penicillium canescens TaxID=5083 RepID=A0AAD6IDA9_PENCN|nr:uncharacterized protein N7446_001953 [Penicillium canescens]KAJ5997429.1 hypothetical protein N7522_009089 [Penicillium canescens]KAJ6043756.1 hypothetical protein N7460_005111 [Penicillium canescens]KAJ6074176.1 hypothetical protein N7446_001953 [Penicillium canescens]
MTDPRSVGLVGSMPQTTFLATLQLLSPDHFVKPYRDLHHPLHWWGVLKQGLKSVEGIFDDFVKDLIKIIHYRVAGGYPPQLAEYTHLLNCARVMGNAPLADEIWDAMYDHQVVPDTACFNHYMGATIWDHCYLGKEAYNLQTTPDSYRKRRMNQPNAAWRGYGTAEHSVRKVIMNIFSDMTQMGLNGDEQTYINIIIAAARVGDRDAVCNVLQTVWNVDVEAIMREKDNSKLPPVAQYDTWSGLYPTDRLLFAVAHAFGTTSDIHAAIRTIDFLSSSYDIPISHEVWYELLERTFILSKTHKGKQAEVELWGRVPKEMVYQVFETMTAEPYNVPPTVKAYRMLTSTSQILGNFEKCQFQLRQAYDVFSKTRAKRKEARDMVLQCLQPILDNMRQKAGKEYCDTQPDPSLFQCPLLAEAIHVYDILRLEVYQQLDQLKRMVNTISIAEKWDDFSIDTWERKERPKFQEEWRDFLPENAKCKYGETSIFYFEAETRAKGRNIDMHGLIHARRLPDRAEIFTSVEEKILDDNTMWDNLLKQWPQLDPSVSPIDRLYSFQVPLSQELKAKLRKMAVRVEIHPDHPVSKGNNPTGGFYARLQAHGLGMKLQRTAFWRDSNHWLQ